MLNEKEPYSGEEPRITMPRKVTASKPKKAAKRPKTARLAERAKRTAVPSKPKITRRKVGTPPRPRKR